jgi:hypothetical protein
LMQPQKDFDIGWGDVLFNKVTGMEVPLLLPVHKVVHVLF